MSDAHFQWHEDARAFANGAVVTPACAPPAAQIAATPVASALTGLFNAFGTTAFCVTDTDVSQIGMLASTHFATLTGGTSGTPKVITRTQASWIASFQTNAGLFDYADTDSIAVLGGLNHSLSLYGVLEGLHLGLNVHVLSDMPPHAQSAELRRHGCRILYATPTQLRLLLKGALLPDIRLILCGGGALDATTRRRITTLCPNAALHVFYGAAETSFVTLSDAATPEDSVGRAYPKAEIILREPDRDGIGTIWLRSPYLFEGYLQGSSSHTQSDGDWITVGEQGRLDAQGNLFIAGRKGRVITVADQTIYPEALEAEICALLQIDACAVLSRTDALRGRHLVAILSGTEDPTIQTTLRDKCKSSGLYPPRDVLFLDPFPLLASGKPDLPRIAQLTGASL